MNSKAKATTGSMKVVKGEDIKNSKRNAINNFCQTMPNSRSLLDIQAAALGYKRNSIQGPSDHIFEDFGSMPSALDQYGFGSSTRNLARGNRNASPSQSQADSNLDIILLDQEKLSLVDIRII